MSEGDADVEFKGADQVLMVHGQPHPVARLAQAQVDAWKAECMAVFPVQHKYHVIYADPPWSYQRMGKVEGRTPYPTMSLEDLKRLPVSQIAAPTSALFMWVTNPLLDKALDLIKAWGFQYKTVFKVWCKRAANGNTISGCGWWSRPSTEMVLVATRGGGYMKWKQTCSEPQEFTGVRRKHSQKPDEIREAVRKFFDSPTGLRRIELFARSQGEGFDAWGLEVPGFFKRVSIQTGAKEEESSNETGSAETGATDAGSTDAGAKEVGTEVGSSARSPNVVSYRATD